MTPLLLVDRIKELCKKKGVSFAEFERDSGVGERTAARWDTNAPSIIKVKQAAEYFEITVSELIGETKKPALTDEDGRVSEFMRLVSGLFGDHPEKLMPLLDSLEREPEKTRAKFDLFLATL